MSYVYDLERNGDVKNHFIFVKGKGSEKTFDINPPLKNVIGLEVNSALIPRSEYTIEDNRNVFEYYIDGDKQEITIISGDYTLTDLLTAINTAAAGAITLTVNTQTSTISVSGTATSLVVSGGTKLNKMLGFDVDTPGISGSIISSIESKEMSTNTINDYLTTDLIHVITSPYIIVDYKTTYNNIESFKLYNNDNKFNQDRTYIRYYISRTLNTEAVYNSTELMYMMGVYYISVTNTATNSIINVNYIFFKPTSRYQSYNFKDDDKSYRSAIFNTLDLSVTPTPFSSIPVTTGGGEQLGDIIITTTQNIDVKLLQSGTYVARGGRYNISGTDVILLKSNIDSFINGGKFNNISAPLAKFYVNNEENSQYVQRINYEQPSRLFFPIFELSKLELSFLEADSGYKYEFHGLEWYLHIVVKTMDYKIPNPIEEKLPPRAEVENIIEVSAQNIKEDRDTEEMKKIYRRVIYVTVAGIVGIYVYRRYINRNN